MGRIARSSRLVKQSWAVLMQDKELLLLPVLSGLSLLVVTASFLVPLGMLGEGGLETTGDGVLYGGLLAFHVVTYTISFFFQAAIVAGASERMAGKDPTLGSALGAPRPRPAARPGRPPGPPRPRRPRPPLRPRLRSASVRPSGSCAPRSGRIVDKPVSPARADGR